MSKYRWDWLDYVWIRRPVLIFLIPIYMIWPLFYDSRQRYKEMLEEFLETWKNE